MLWVTYAVAAGQVILAGIGAQGGASKAGQALKNLLVAPPPMIPAKNLAIGAKAMALIQLLSLRMVWRHQQNRPVKAVRASRCQGVRD